MKTGLVFSWGLALEAPQCVLGLFEARAEYRLDQRSHAHLHLPISCHASVLHDSLLLYQLFSACLVVVTLGFLECSGPGPGHRRPCLGLVQNICSLCFLSVPKAAVLATGGTGWHQSAAGCPGSTAALQAGQLGHVPRGDPFPCSVFEF